MMKFCAATTREYGVPTTVSLNPIMVDGTGMCGACRVSVGGETTFGCVDGPDFDGHAVDFEELMSRQRIYADDEREADAEYSRGCCMPPVETAAGRATRSPATSRPRRPRARPCASAVPRSARSDFDEVAYRLLRRRGARRGEALPAVQEPDVHRGLPGQHRHQVLHRRHHRRRPAPRRRGPQGAQRAARRVRARLPAGGAVRGAVRARQEGRARRDRPARALPGRLRPDVRHRAPLRARGRASRPASAAPSSAPARRVWRARASSRGSATRSRSSSRCTRRAAC